MSRIGTKTTQSPRRTDRRSSGRFGPVKHTGPVEFGIRWVRREGNVSGGSFRYTYIHVSSWSVFHLFLWVPFPMKMICLFVFRVIDFGGVYSPGLVWLLNT